MGDLAKDTAVTRVRGRSLRGDAERRLGDLGTDGRVRGRVRAAGRRRVDRAPSTRRRSRATTWASRSSARIDLQVSTRKRGRAATAQRVEITQDDRPILDAMVWSVNDGEGLEHDETTMPAVPGPEVCPRSATSSRRTPPDRRSRSGRTSRRSRSSSRSRWPPDGPAPGALAGMAAVHADADLRRPVGRRDPLRDPRRPPELAVGAPTARVEAAAVHRADARLERRVPSADQPARTGCCATARPRSRPAGSSAGPPASGPRAASSTRPAAASASTAGCRHPRPDPVGR